jgi:hypothetical protein
LCLSRSAPHRRVRLASSRSLEREGAPACRSSAS